LPATAAPEAKAMVLFINWRRFTVPFRVLSLSMGIISLPHSVRAAIGKHLCWSCWLADNISG
jgi:hypothetical protein